MRGGKVKASIKFKWIVMKETGDRICHFHITGLGDFKMTISDYDDSPEPDPLVNVANYVCMIAGPCEQITDFIYQTYIWPLVKDPDIYFATSYKQGMSLCEEIVMKWFKSFKLSMNK